MEVHRRVPGGSSVVEIMDLSEVVWIHDEGGGTL